MWNALERYLDVTMKEIKNASKSHILLECPSLQYQGSIIMGELRFNNDERRYIKTLLLREKGKEAEKLVKRIDRSMRPIKVSSAKGKGRSLQYWVCERIAKMFGIEFVQSDDNCLIHSREMGQRNVDIVTRGWIHDAFRFDVECKAQENLSLSDWIQQAKSNTNENRDWLLVIKKKSIGEPFVVMDWEAFEKLVKNSSSFNNCCEKQI